MQAKAIPKIYPEHIPGPKRVYHPRQLALFTNTPDPIPIGIHWEPDEGEEVIIDEGLSMVKNERSSQLIISGFGVFLEEKNERLIVSKQGKVIYEFPLLHMNEVIISSKGVSISSDLISILCQKGVRLSFLGSMGKPFAMITSPLLTSTTITRREQILAFRDRRGVELSKAILTVALHNQEKLLLFFQRSFRQKDVKRLGKVQEAARSIKLLKARVRRIQGENIDEVRSALMDIDGEGERMYWDGLSKIIDLKFEFLGRVYQHAGQIVSAMLNYGYGLLYSQVWGAVLHAGLEPFAGFMHVEDQPGKSSLVLDLVKEFRQPIVDLPIITQVSMGEICRMHNGLLYPETRQSIAKKILERLESSEVYEGKEYRIKSIIQIQARRLAAFLQGEKKYKPFRFKEWA
ncbi:MAG: CRISPR-associated endonuclease Cas1 [bacterium]